MAMHKQNLETIRHKQQPAIHPFFEFLNPAPSIDLPLPQPTMSLPAIKSLSSSRGRLPQSFQPFRGLTILNPDRFKPSAIPNKLERIKEQSLDEINQLELKEELCNDL